MSLLGVLVNVLIGDGLSFLSFGYLLFLAAAALVRYLLPRGSRKSALLLLSWAFYCTWNPACLIFVVISTVTTYLTGLYVGRRDASRRKTALALCLLLNLGLLFFCRYWEMFFPGTLEDRLIPLGISFYTMQALGYVIDCWRWGARQADAAALCPSTGGTDAAGSGAGAASGNGAAASSMSDSAAPAGSTAAALAGSAPEQSFVRYALFVSFFPGILSGPIERGRNMLPQFSEPEDFHYDNLRNGLLIMLWGYFLKMVIADRIAIVVDTVYASPQGWGGTIVVLAVLLYSLQIYCDFAGYSAIAVGSARVLGFRVMQNFEAPYLSASIPEFWRRWHISLSTWFRDYLYIPLGGSRKGLARRCLNLMIVFAASGLWHGADITYVIWGLLHGLYQVAGYLLKPVRDVLVRVLRVDRSAASHRLLCGIVTFVLVSFAWIFFRADSMAQAGEIIRGMAGFQPWRLFDGTLLRLGLDAPNWVLLALSIAIVIVRDRQVYRGVSLRVLLQRQGVWLRWLVYIAAVLLILVCGIWGPDYDAATFIYSQF